VRSSDMNHKHPKSAVATQPFSSDDIDGAIRVLRSLEQGLGRKTASGGPAAKPEELVAMAKFIQTVRSERSALFDGDLFGEASWDIMLSLYISQRQGYRMKVSSVCHESGVPETTALRWLDRLVQLGLARKSRNPYDSRSNFVELTDGALDKMDLMMESALEKNAHL
jgi:DNA-binding MarR family transcriptional regulator